MKNKIFTLFLALIASIATISADVAYSGSCGENLTWIVDFHTKTLTITGNGAMTNYGNASSQPWNSIRDSIKTIIIGEGVTTIGSYAFTNLGITSISLPQTLVTIGNSGLYGNQLPSITLPASLTKIFDYGLAFSWAMSEVYFEGNTPPTLGAEAFYNLKSGTKIKVPCGYADDYRNASGWSGLYAAIYSDCEELRHDGKCGTNLIWVHDDSTKSLTITGNGAMTNYGNASSQPWNYMRDAIKTIIIGVGVTTIGSYAFTNLGVTSISLPQTLVTIGNSGLYGNQLPSITLPASLTKIFDYGLAFSWVMSEVYFEGDIPPTLGAEAFYNLKSGTKIKVPCGYVDDYRNASGWSGLYAAIEEDCSGVEIPEYTVFVTSNDESKGTVTGGGTFKEEGLTIISATPNEGYIFDKWNDEVTSNPRIVTISQDSSFVAFFKPIEYSVNISVYPENAGSVTNPSTAHHNENIAISVNTNEGHKFLQWSDGNKDVQREIHVEGNINLTALFAVVETDTIRDTITVEIKDTLQTLYVESSNPAQGATYVQIVAIPEAGYEFLCWSDFNTENPRMVVLGEKNVQSYTAYFMTSQNVPTSVSTLTSNEELQKLIRNGNVYILTGDKTYTVTGQEVR